MVSNVLDASAVIRFLDGEPGVREVTEMFLEALHGRCELLISAVNWGEVAGKLFQRHGAAKTTTALSALLRKGLKVVEATGERASAAAIIKVTYKIPYADAFGVELASDSPQHVLVTADFDVAPAQGLINITFLPKKP